jgi:hypothetical protein
VTQPIAQCRMPPRAGRVAILLAKLFDFENGVAHE